MGGAQGVGSIQIDEEDEGLEESKGQYDIGDKKRSKKPGVGLGKIDENEEVKNNESFELEQALCGGSSNFAASSVPSKGSGNQKSAQSMQMSNSDISKKSHVVSSSEGVPIRREISRNSRKFEGICNSELSSKRQKRPPKD